MATESLFFSSLQPSAGGPCSPSQIGEGGVRRYHRLSSPGSGPQSLLLFLPQPTDLLRSAQIGSPRRADGSTTQMWCNNTRPVFSCECVNESWHSSVPDPFPDTQAGPRPPGLNVLVGTAALRRLHGNPGDNGVLGDRVFFELVGSQG